MLPLYREITRPARYTAGGNAGLWYDKFCNQWQVRSPKREVNTSLGPRYHVLEGESKKKWISTVTSQGAVGDKKHLAEVIHRMRELTQACGGLALELVTDSSFVTGMGRSHPIENGFAWHHTLGTPYLPGSSIKGLLRAWIKSQSGGVDGALTLWFGDPGQVGRVCFLDALPLEPVELGIDVMTPHYAGWTPANPPGDWMSPTPIPFLVVKRCARFLFCMVPQDESLSAGDLHTLKDHLIEALQWMGVGAKTATGYGRFAEQPSAPACPSQPESPVRLKPGDIVSATLLEERTRKGGWKAQEATSGRVGYIENSASVPQDKKAGDTVQLELRSDHADGTLAFRWLETRG